MKREDLARGEKYALRTKPTDQSSPFLKVTYVGPARGRQCRIRYDEGEYRGMEEWVPTRQLMCRWGQRKALARDEERAAYLAEADTQTWDQVTDDAVSAVMTASGEYGGFGRSWDTDPASAERYWARAGLTGSPLQDHPANYADRHGTWHLTFSTAVKASQAFAAAEPELVDLYLRGWEEQLKAEGFQPGRRHDHDLLRRWAPSHALARDWAQVPRGYAAEKEIQRLRGLVQAAVRDLREAEMDDKAARLERGLRGQ